MALLSLQLKVFFDKITHSKPKGNSKRMDPLSIIASVAGLLSLSGQLYTVFKEYTDAHANAPRCVRLILAEIGSLRAIFRQVQHFIDNAEELDESRASMLAIADLVSVLTGCVCVFSLLEREILSNGPESYDFAIKWACKEETQDDIAQSINATLAPNSSIFARAKAFRRYVNKEPILVRLLEDLTAHKQNLGLMMTIINCSTNSEALHTVQKLSASMESLRTSNRDVPQRANELMSRGEHPADAVERNNEYERTVAMSGMSTRSITRAFERILRASRPYKSTIVWNDGFSMDSSAMKHTRWTTMSDMSLSEISNIAVIDLPIYPPDLWSYEAYGVDERACSLRNLVEAARKGDYEGVELALDEGANVDGCDHVDQTALIIAAGKGHYSVARLLLERGASTEAVLRDQMYTHTAIVAAASSGQDRIIELLLEFGANINVGHGRAVYESAFYGHESTVRLLIAHGVDINSYRLMNEQETVLHAAARRGNANIVQLLIDNGANTKARDAFFRTPRRLAASCGHRAVVDILT